MGKQDLILLIIVWDTLLMLLFLNGALIADMMNVIDNVLDILPLNMFFIMLYQKKKLPVKVYLIKKKK